MCYSIPGKIIEICDRVATVDYFGERRKAYIDLVDDAKVGDNVYAQGGFVIRTITEAEAQEVLDIWKDIFFKLKEQDARLASNPQNLYERANAIRQKHQDNSCCVHGIIEFSNYCRCSCLYCGIRNENQSVKRYRMDTPEILEAVDEAVALGFQALVLQSGEDPFYTDDKLEEIVKSIRARHKVLIFVSVGERSLDAYRRMYDAGARGVLMRFETSNETLYSDMKPGSKLSERLETLRALRKMGYLLVTGFLVGLPSQRTSDVMKDIKMTASLDAEMFSFGPFIPHPETPLKESKLTTRSGMLNAIARARIANPDAKILVTTALETLWGLDGAKDALMAGANSLMINVTPEKYRELYNIYPERFGTKIKIQDHIDMVIDLLRGIGRAPTDLSVG